jgi:hypothetical protein
MKKQRHEFITTIAWLSSIIFEGAYQNDYTSNKPNRNAAGGSAGRAGGAREVPRGADCHEQVLSVHKQRISRHLGQRERISTT